MFEFGADLSSSNFCTNCVCVGVARPPTGSHGNKTQQKGPLFLFILITALMIVLHCYFLLWQTYMCVQNEGMIFCRVFLLLYLFSHGISENCICLLFTFVHLMFYFGLFPTQSSPRASHQCHFHHIQRSANRVRIHRHDCIHVDRFIVMRNRAGQAAISFSSVERGWVSELSSMGQF